MEPADEEELAIIRMLSERVNDKDIEEEVENLNDILGDAADLNKMTKTVQSLKQ